MLILDAHLPPSLAVWITRNFGIDTYSAAFIGMRDANDAEIFAEARRRHAIVLTKDDDFVQLLNCLGSPPKIIWLTCGNTSKQHLKLILQSHLSTALRILENADLVELSGG